MMGEITDTQKAVNLQLILTPFRDFHTMEGVYGDEEESVLLLRSFSILGLSVSINYSDDSLLLVSPIGTRPRLSK